MLEENLNQAENDQELTGKSNHNEDINDIDDKPESSNNPDSAEVSKEEEIENKEKLESKLVEEDQVHFLPHDHYQYQLFEIQKTYKMDGFRTGAVDVRIIDFHERNKILSDLFYRKSIYDLIKDNCFPVDFSVKSYKFDQEKKGWEYTVHVKYEDYRDAIKKTAEAKSEEIKSETEATCDEAHKHDEHCSHHHHEEKKHKKEETDDKNSNIKESETVYDSDDESFSAKKESKEEIKEKEETIEKIEEPVKNSEQTPSNETDTWDSL